MGNVFSPLLVLALATSTGLCGKAAPDSPRPPPPTCLERLSTFHSCSSKPAGNWKLVDTCNDSPPPFYDVRGCEDVSWVSDKQSRHLDGSLLCTSSGTCSSVTSVSGDSTMVLSEGCLFGIAHASSLESDLPPSVCHALEVSFTQVQAIKSATCNWDGRNCTCPIAPAHDPFILASSISP